MLGLNRFRLRAWARPARRWAVAVALAVVTGVVVHARTTAAEVARDRWGRRVAVLVAAADLTPGTPLSEAAVRVDQWPAAVVGPGVVAADVARDGQVVALPVLAGEAVRRGHLVGGGEARVPAGRRAVAVAADGAPELRVGDRVDVVDADDGAVVARAAVVVDAADAVITVAVTADELPRVASAASRGTVVLALAPDD